MLLRHRIIGETPRAANSNDNAKAIAQQLMQRTLAKASNSSSRKIKSSKLSTSTAVQEEMMLAALARASSDINTESDGHGGMLTDATPS
jgi:replicative DNA helicase